MFQNRPFLGERGTGVLEDLSVASDLLVASGLLVATDQVGGGK